MGRKEGEGEGGQRSPSLRKLFEMRRCRRTMNGDVRFLHFDELLNSFTLTSRLKTAADEFN